MNEMFSVKDKVFVITGGAGILGTSMVKHFAAQGGKVVVLDLNEEKGNELVGEVKKAVGEAMFLKTNVLDRDILQKNCDEIIARYGRIDVLINGAGGNMPGATIAPDKTIFDLEIDAFKKVVDLNLFGIVLPTMVFAKPMTERKEGIIINISSESAIRPLTRVCGYGAAKAAVTNFTQYLAGELAIKYGDKMRVNAIAPGFFITDQNRALLTNPDGSYTERSIDILRNTPFKRFGKPEELLGTLQWLASDASKFVTGTMTVIDGGFAAFSI